MRTSSGQDSYFYFAEQYAGEGIAAALLQRVSDCLTAILGRTLALQFSPWSTPVFNVYGQKRPYIVRVCFNFLFYIFYLVKQLS